MACTNGLRGDFIMANTIKIGNHVEKLEVGHIVLINKKPYIVANTSLDRLECRVNFICLMNGNRYTEPQSSLEELLEEVDREYIDFKIIGNATITIE